MRVISNARLLRRAAYVALGALALLLLIALLMYESDPRGRIVMATGGAGGAYHALAHRLFSSQRNIRNVRSFFSVHRSKFDTAVPLP